MKTDWHKSTYSATGGNCVEIRAGITGADMRDTQNREDGYLTFARDEWMAALSGVFSHSR